MELLPNKKPFLIYLTHQDKKFEAELKDIIMSEIKNVEVQTFVNRADILLNGNQLPRADLIIIDLLFDNEDHLEKAQLGLQKVYNNTSTPFLLMTNAETFDQEKVSFIKDYPDLHFDFIDQSHFYKFIFINRIKVLLSIPKISKIMGYQKLELQRNLWMALDYSNVFIIILDKNFKVALCNYQLAKALGFESEDEMLGKDWAQFIRLSENDMIKYVHSQTLLGNKTYEEFTNDIVSKDNKITTVKWFNTLINNNFNCVFSIGVPITKEPNINADVESVRAYFTGILKSDRTTINAMKEVALKHNQEIIEKHTNGKGGKC